MACQVEFQVESSLPFDDGLDRVEPRAAWRGEAPVSAAARIEPWAWSGPARPGTPPMGTGRAPPADAAVAEAARFAPKPAQPFGAGTGPTASELRGADQTGRRRAAPAK